MSRQNSKDRFRQDWMEALYWSIRFKSKEKAAIELDVDKKTIAYRIKKLEEAWGEELIKSKKWQGTIPTPLGKVLFDIAKRQIRRHAFIMMENLRSFFTHQEKKKSRSEIPQRTGKKDE